MLLKKANTYFKFNPIEVYQTIKVIKNFQVAKLLEFTQCQIGHWKRGLSW